MSARGQSSRDWLKIQIIRALALPPVRALARPVYAGEGVIFTLHRVVESPQDTLVPGIAITTAFLEAMIALIRRSGYDFVPLSEVPARLTGNARRGRWVCLTFDDGYRDNLTIASPVLTRHGVPYSLFLVSDWVTGARTYNAAVLEQFVLDHREVTFTHAGVRYAFATNTFAEKMSAYAAIDLMRWRDRTFDAALPSVLLAQGRSATDVMQQQFLQSGDVRQIAADGCCELGSHTRTHPALAHLPESDARSELQDSRAALATLLGRAPDLIAYPYGSAGQCGPREYQLAEACGYRVGVTTRIGNVFRSDASHPLSLPRTGLSLHPHGHSKEFIVSVLAGSRNALMNRGRRARD